MTEQQEWLSNLMSVYGQEILYFVRFYARSARETEDLTQDVFLRAYRGYDQFRGDSHIKTWLLRIAVNVCKDHHRKERRRPVQYVDQIPEPRSVQTQMHGPHPAGVAPSAEEEALKKISAKGIVDSVLRLPDSYKDIILLHYFEGQSVQEISETLQIRPSTVKTRLFRARRMLQSEEVVTNEQEPGGVI